MKIALLVVLVVVGIRYAVVLAMDIYQHWQTVRETPINNTALSVSALVMMFLSTLGVSDFAVGTALYRRLKWVPLKQLPATLNTEVVIPTLFMAMLYISSVNVAPATLLTCIVAQGLGAWIGPRIAVRLPENTIRLTIAIGLVIAVGSIIGTKLGLLPTGGSSTALSGPKLVIAAVLLFCFGFLNDIGIGSNALIMATVYLLGLSTQAAFPIMMGAASFSLSLSGVKFVHLGAYSRKVVLLMSTVGLVGVALAAFVFNHLQTTWIQWLVVVVLLYTIYQLVLELINVHFRKVAVCDDK